MKLKKECYGGKLGFFLRKKMPTLGSNIYLTTKRMLSHRISKKYIQKSLAKEEIHPIVVSIETINRCNGECAFCTCNRHEDKRKLEIMQDETFEKIISDLEKIDYDKMLMLVVNNEPFMDKKIIQRLEYARNHLKKAHMRLFTNGSIINQEQLDYIISKKLLDELIINNYNSTMELNKNIKKIEEHLKGKDLPFELTINLRYKQEVLSNRANSSPNKTGEKEIKSLCTIPYTDINIAPNGNLFLCCCDAKEKTNFGNVNEKNLIEIFNSKEYKNLRDKMKNGRNNNEFCKFCDFIDVGTRKVLMTKEL